MKKLCGLLLILLPVVLFAQTPQKYALVIGNGAYENLSRLPNPVNDADDVAAALQGLGFTVEKITNGNLDQMEAAAIRLRNRLSVSSDSYGFFFYAGHAVQSGGENYLIPVDANIQMESSLRNRAFSVQDMLDELSTANNTLNVVVLDACRDNPFTWRQRSGGSRGLTILSNQPTGSIIVFATRAGQTASDGDGRNGLFTTHLLPNLLTPGLEVKEVFNRTGADVEKASGGNQIPVVYVQFFPPAYLGSGPAAIPSPPAPSVPTVPIVPTVVNNVANIVTGSLEITTVTAGVLQIIGIDVNETAELPVRGIYPVESINAGHYRIIMKYYDGQTEEKAIEVTRSGKMYVAFSYRPAFQPETPAPLPVNPGFTVPVSPTPVVPADEGTAVPAKARMNAVGGSLGTSFSAPWFIGTIEGTYAPWNNPRMSNIFIHLGLDAGLASGYSEVKHRTLYVFARFSYLFPIANGGINLGAGAGFMVARYTFPEGETKRNFMLADVSAGYIFGFGLTVSYSLRTNFTSVNHKMAVGYLYRFM